MQNVSRKSFLQTLTLGGGSLLTVGLGDKAEAQPSAGSGGHTASLKSDAFALTPHPPEAVRIGLGAAATREELQRALEAVRDVLGGSPSWAASLV